MHLSDERPIRPKDQTNLTSKTYNCIKPGKNETMNLNRETMPTKTVQAGIARSDSPLEDTRVTMFYDGGCSLCGREVAHYRRIDRANRVQWVDISANPGLLASVSIRYEEAMARLHVVDRSGKVRTGAWAFAAVWDELPYYRWLARVVRALRLLPAIDVAYVHFARWRLRRRGCESGHCENP